MVDLAYKRIAVTGPPGSGKTTLTEDVDDDRPVIHTDDWKHIPWSYQPHKILKALEGLDSFVVEGIAVPRLLKRDLKIDLLIILQEPRVVITDAQEKLWNNMVPTLSMWLQRSGHVQIERW